MGPCMCGDYCCPSCGPLLGNSRCPICNEWVSEGCKHLSKRTGNLLKRYEAQAHAKAKAQAEADDAYAESLREDARLAEEFWAEEAKAQAERKVGRWGLSDEEIERLVMYTF